MGGWERDVMDMGGWERYRDHCRGCGNGKLREGKVGWGGGGVVVMGGWERGRDREDRHCMR
jgi:hypothetical protein